MQGNHHHNHHNGRLSMGAIPDHNAHGFMAQQHPSDEPLQPGWTHGHDQRDGNYKTSVKPMPAVQHEPIGIHLDCGLPSTAPAGKTYTTVDIESQSSPITPVSSPSIDAMAEKPSNGSESTTVTFDGPHDPLNPQNWPSKRKWAATACIASFTFLSPLASTMVAPALTQIQQDLKIASPVETQMVLSVFVLAFAIGPMLLGPLSELYGRVIVTQASSIVFLVFNTLCGFASSRQQLLTYRFLAGFGGSAPLAIGGGVIGDLFKPEERGKAMGLYAMGPLLGPAIGPIMGGWVSDKSTWKWMFWAVSIANGVILGSGLLSFNETYAPYILHRKAKALRKETGNMAYLADGEAGINQPIWRKVYDSTTRSFRMFFTQPIVQVMSLYMGFSFGILYLMLSTYSELFLTRYHETVGIAGLNSISLGLGLFIGAPICGKANDMIYVRLKAKDPQGRGRPEFRMPLVVPFSLLVPTGLLIYGWTAQAGVHWIVPNIGVFIFGIGTIAAFQCVTTYLVDAYTRFAASAIAAVTILRSLMGFAFPLFAPAMYRALDYGWGNTLLAFLALVIGIPTPILLWFFGEKLRKKSSMTAGMGHSKPTPVMKPSVDPPQPLPEAMQPETICPLVGMATTAGHTPRRGDTLLQPPSPAICARKD